MVSPFRLANAGNVTVVVNYKDKKIVCQGQTKENPRTTTKILPVYSRKISLSQLSPYYGGYMAEITIGEV